MRLAFDPPHKSGYCDLPSDMLWPITASDGSAAAPVGESWLTTAMGLEESDARRGDKVPAAYVVENNVFCLQQCQHSQPTSFILSSLFHDSQHMESNAFCHH